MRQVKSALALHLRPSAHILALKKPTADWSQHDHTLAMAYSVLESETCDKCGHPIWVCRNTDNRITFRVETYTCFADKELQKTRKKWEERNKGKPNKERLKDGEYEYTVPKMTDDSPLPSRAEWYMSRNNG